MIAASLLNGHHLFKRQVCSFEIFHKYNMSFKGSIAQKLRLTLKDTPHCFLVGQSPLKQDISASGREKLYQNIFLI